MPNMKQFQSGRMLVATSLLGLVSGGFVIGLGAGYALWEYPVAPLLDTVLGGESPAVTVDSPVADNAPAVELSELEFQVIRASEATGLGNYAEAINQLMLADLSAVSAQEIEKPAYLLNKVVNLQVSQLRQTQRVEDIEALFESLTLAMPERAEFYPRLAEHRMDMGNNQGALSGACPD